VSFKNACKERRTAALCHCPTGLITHRILVAPRVPSAAIVISSGSICAASTLAGPGWSKEEPFREITSRDVGPTTVSDRVLAKKNGAAQSLRVEGTSHVGDDGALPGHLAFSGEADCG